MAQILRLGGSASNVIVGKIGHGLMMMTWKANVSPEQDQQCFEAIKAGVDALPPGAKMFINSGEFYGPNLSTANLEMLSRFFEKYPEYADKTFLSVKGGLKHLSFEPDASPENLRRSIDNINAALRGTKRVDLFQSARVDHRVPIEDAIKTMKGLIDEGKFDHIGMSECRADTLRRGNSVHPITAVEIEASPWSYEDETKKVIATAQELNISVAAYSPLGRGFLAGRWQSIDDLPADDRRRNFARFKPENFEHNIMIVKAVKALADKKGITPAQLCIAWVAHLGPHMLPIPGSSHKDRTLENVAAANVDLSSEDMDSIGRILLQYPVKGGRYWDASEAELHLWG
ncbi:Aldo/keto reductase [Gloeophyllum trabeum ATCC 11539]|uniref:Aldo/keto reductase n=1 Tax=Gloeophyllum trabeum (strain ATCC 11539 / FP-39264 / Madison 617) TaxID=670483 RepID=S7RG47_GLOTA|nr:Aldo/keto reductase [Gloeophyllum trabeum ATCC 11539]EPQ53205.1 Aldo/keto reductase [Gloeophyllum trabeum ATCC 11539]